MKKNKFVLAFILFFAPFVFGKDFVLKQDSGSVATGITVCFKNKKFLEKKYNLPAGSDYLAHIFKVKFKKFEEDFKLIGAEVQFYDYPFIPFDDYYTNDYFGFVRIKVLPENTEKALFLAKRLIEETKSFDNKDFVIAAKSVMGSNMMRNKGKIKAVNEIWKCYFPEGFVSLPNYCFAPRLSENDLRKFAAEYLDNSNIFVSVYGKFNKKKIETFLKENFSVKNREKTALKVKLPIATLKTRKKTLKSNFKQAFVYLVYPVKDNLDLNKLVNLKILTLNASRKIAFQIREREGLAYSVGCHLEFKGGHLFFVAYCATDPKKADYVSDKMQTLIKQYMFEEINFSSSDLEVLKNGIILSDTLKTLPNVNKSFFNALYSLTGFEGYDKNRLDKVVKKAKIRRLCGKGYLDNKNYLNIILK